MKGFFAAFQTVFFTALLVEAKFKWNKSSVDLKSGWNAPNWKNCSNEKLMGQVSSVQVTAEVDPVSRDALLKKGTSVNLKISFVSDEVSDTLKADVHGIIEGVPVPFPLKNSNACKNCSITCPVKKTGHYDYIPTIEVLTSYPKLKLVVKWEVKDDNGNDMLCILIPVEIVD